MLVALLGAGGLASVASADGDPGSDVLVYQPLFLSTSAGISISRQVELDGLLRRTSHAGFPLRVAIIATRSDLGAITGLWGKPRDYARFLGLELSLAYRGRLLVVMPNGFGFNWPGHPVAAAYHKLAGIKVAPRRQRTRRRDAGGDQVARAGNGGRDRLLRDRDDHCGRLESGRRWLSERRRPRPRDG